jgi:hypothetical protein
MDIVDQRRFIDHKNINRDCGTTKLMKTQFAKCGSKKSLVIVHFQCYNVNVVFAIIHIMNSLLHVSYVVSVTFFV